MKIVLNIEKKHLYVFTAFLLLLGAGIVIANNPQVFHDVLYVDKLTLHTVTNSNIEVDSNLKINSGKNLTIGTFDIEQTTEGSDSYLKIGNLKIKSDGSLCDIDGTCRPIDELVAGSSTCGDGNCDQGETIQNCPSDCDTNQPYTFTGNELVYSDGKKLYNNGDTAKQFCIQLKGCTDYNTGSGGVASSQCTTGQFYKKAANVNNVWVWQDYNCNPQDISTYITSLECLGCNTYTYEFGNLGQYNLILGIDPANKQTGGSGSYDAPNTNYYLLGKQEDVEQNAKEFCKAMDHADSTGDYSVATMCSNVPLVTVTYTSTQQQSNHKVVIDYTPYGSNHWQQNWDCDSANPNILTMVKCIGDIN